MPEKSQAELMLESFEQSFTELDEVQRRIDSYRMVRKNDPEFQMSVDRRQEELDMVRGELVKRYRLIKEFNNL